MKIWIRKIRVLLSVVLFVTSGLAHADITTGLVAWYRFEGNVNDSSGNNYTGTPTNITYGTGKLGQDAVFNGGTSYITVPGLTGNLPSGTTPRTVSFWAKPSSTASHGDIVSWGSNYTAGHRFSVLMQAGGRLDLIGQSDDHTSNYYFSAGQWTHVTVTFNGTSTLIFYVNGQPYATVPVAGLNTDAGYPLVMGMNVAGGSGEYFNGDVDEVRIYNRVLTANDVQQLYSYSLLANPTVALATNNNPSIYGQSVTLTATVSGGVNPTGTINFLDGTSSISGCSAVSLSGTAATCTTSALSAGSHSITAAYSGDSNNAAATSTALAQSVSLPSSLSGSNPGGGGTITTNTTAPSGCGLVQAQTGPIPSFAASSAPSGVSFPYGEETMVVSGSCGTGYTATITLTYPNAVPTNAQIWKYGKSSPADTSDHWYQLGSANNVQISGNTVSYTVTDGGLGDDDVTVDGTITDPVALGIPSTAPIPTLGALGLVILSALMVLLGMVGVWVRGRSARPG